MCFVSWVLTCLPLSPGQRQVDSANSGDTFGAQHRGGVGAMGTGHEENPRARPQEKTCERVQFLAKQGCHTPQIAP